MNKPYKNHSNAIKKPSKTIGFAGFHRRRPRFAATLGCRAMLVQEIQSWAPEALTSGGRACRVTTFRGPRFRFSKASDGEHVDLFRPWLYNLLLFLAVIYNIFTICCTPYGSKPLLRRCWDRFSRVYHLRNGASWSPRVCFLGRLQPSLACRAAVARAGPARPAARIAGEVLRDGGR